MLLVDDGSTDATPAFATIWPCRTTASGHHQKNAGICAARNRGFPSLRACMSTFCDDDDLLLPGALALLLQKAGGHRR